MTGRILDIRIFLWGSTRAWPTIPREQTVLLYRRAVRNAMLEWSQWEKRAERRKGTMDSGLLGSVFGGQVAHAAEDDDENGQQDLEKGRVEAGDIPA